MIKPDPIQLDALREISSIGAGNAATSLSTMLGQKVNMTVLGVTVEALQNVPQILGGEGKVTNAVYFSVSGQVSGTIFLILPMSESLSLVRILTGRKVARMEDLDKVGLSALKELGNIVVGTYLRAFGRVLKMRMTYSIPGFASDMLGAILDGTLARLVLKAPQTVIVDNEFTVGKDVSKIQLVFILEPESLQVMLGVLGVRGKKQVTR